ncbi:MAG: hypothetical protein K2G83_07325 [Ruminococcus sp.]|nr:hypothetical protein [Ruminococcus sp.]
MKEITNADSFKMNMNSIFDAVLMQIYEREDVDYCSEETNLRIQGFVDYTSNLMMLDAKSKISIINELDFIINTSNSEAFESGLKIGLSVLKNLLTTEMPVIHTVNSEMPKFERRCKSADGISDIDERLINYMKKTFPYLEKEQKFELQGRMEALVHFNTMKQYGLL